jgi:hypothetical protein
LPEPSDDNIVPFPSQAALKVPVCYHDRTSRPLYENPPETVFGQAAILAAFRLPLAFDLVHI